MIQDVQPPASSPAPPFVAHSEPLVPAAESDCVGSITSSRSCSRSSNPCVDEQLLRSSLEGPVIENGEGVSLTAGPSESSLSDNCDTITASQPTLINSDAALLSPSLDPPPPGRHSTRSAPLPFIDFSSPSRIRGAVDNQAFPSIDASNVSPSPSLSGSPHNTIIDMSQDGVKSTQPSPNLATQHATDWDHFRNAKDIRGGKGETVWYKTSGRYEVSHPPSSLAATVDTIYIHVDERTGRSKSWVLNSSSIWVSVRAGDKQPSDSERRLNIQRNGDPSWVTKETWTVYRSRRKQRRLIPLELLGPVL
ncbi:hypothetical protein C2E23DRAFT_811054 [Lenzites betulinus]|nr:hypothetical protein C2E23DRAFT_811054 [Lenzites betulinus]